MKCNVQVTLGMCVKNAETTVKQAMESVINQDFPHKFMQLIVVDGCSKDRTLSVVENCLGETDLQNKIFHENEGLGRARQIVVDNADGNYIVWVDGDMILSGDFVRKQVDFMENNPQVGIAKGKYEMTPGPDLLATLEIYSRAGAKLEDYNSQTARSKSLGTSGCIYRVGAIRQAGGFDEKITGYGEDWDAEYRTRRAGWKLCTTQVRYRDYERLGLTWKNLWRRYWQRGYDLYRVFQKHKCVIRLYRMLPPAAFLSGLLKSLTLYKLTRRKIVYLLPFQHTLKNVAWWMGFARRAYESSIQIRFIKK